MKALVDETNVTKDNLQSNLELLALLKKKIEKFIIDEEKICVTVSNDFVECRNNFIIESYEFNDDYWYISDGWFEIHIEPSKINKIMYEDVCEECFKIIHKDTEINLYF